MALLLLPSQVSLSWQVQAPFAIMPPTAVLEPGASGSFELQFLPTEAAGYHVVATCSLDSGQRYEVQVGASGSLEQCLEHAICMMPGSCVAQHRVLCNATCGPPCWHDRHARRKHGAAMLHAPAGDACTAHSRVCLPALAHESATHTGRAMCLTMQVAGTGKLPYLSLEASSIDFGDAVVGSRCEQLLCFGNHSQVPARFRLVPEQPGSQGDQAFSITPSQ